jgi:putative flippase GtrA
MKVSHARDLARRPTRHAGSLRRTARYLAVGLASTALDLTLFAVLQIYVGLPSLIANTASYGSGIVGNYALQRSWTFRDRTGPGRALGKQFAQFLVVSLMALALNNLLVLAPGAAAVRLIGSVTFGLMLAKLGATGVGTLWGLAANTLWTFRPATPAGH